MNCIAVKVDRFGERSAYRFYDRGEFCMVVRLSNNGIEIEKPVPFTPLQASSFLRNLQRVGWIVESQSRMTNHPR
jgi:hypothetical protein